MAAAYGQVELCAFLLQVSPRFRDDAALHSAFKEYLAFAIFSMDRPRDNQLMDRFYEVFVNQFDMDIKLYRSWHDT